MEYTCSEDFLQISGTTVEVWSRPLSASGSLAVAFLQLANKGDPIMFKVRTGNIGLKAANGYSVTDGFTGETLITTTGPDTVLKILVNPNGVVLVVAKPI